jgi:hypothetical protein
MVYQCNRVDRRSSAGALYCTWRNDPVADLPALGVQSVPHAPFNHTGSTPSCHRETAGARPLDLRDLGRRVPQGRLRDGRRPSPARAANREPARSRRGVSLARDAVEESARGDRQRKELGEVVPRQAARVSLARRVVPGRGAARVAGAERARVTVPHTESKRPCPGLRGRKPDALTGKPARQPLTGTAGTAEHR